MTPETFKKLQARVLDHYNNNVNKVYVFDGYSGANPASRKKVSILLLYDS
jgi:ATP-dependent phosphoenolpyruvate carboxykinase